jgi:hypothetical protein
MWPRKSLHLLFSLNEFPHSHFFDIIVFLFIFKLYGGNSEFANLFP